MSQHFHMGQHHVREREGNAALQERCLAETGEGKDDRMELTMELVEVEDSLELWTLERDQKRFISSLDTACGK